MERTTLKRLDDGIQSVISYFLRKIPIWKFPVRYDTLTLIHTGW